MATNTAEEYKLSLSKKQLTTLLIVLEEAFKDTQTELARTDLQLAQEVVREHEEVIQSILESARKLVPEPSRA